MKNIVNLQDVLVKQKNSTETIVFCSSTAINDTLSYKDIYWNALALLNYLQENDIERDSHLVFQISDPKKFIITFWACILGGIIPVPLSVVTKDQGIKKIASVWNYVDKPFLAIENQAVLETLKIYANNNKLFQFCDEIDFYNVNIENFEIESNINNVDLNLENKIASIESENTAFIQFSSGSTGSPKGVVLTNGNLIANIQGIIKSSNMTTNDSHLSWLPLTHDMGLINAHLTPSFLGLKQVIISTDIFVKFPRIWMEQVDKYRASILHTPNYGLKILASSIGQKMFNWNLSCVRIIFTGAEPISLKICDQFIETLSPYKLNKNAICPAYGLAEACVAVAIANPKDSIRAYHLDRNSMNLGEAIKEISPYSKDAMTVIDVGTAVNNCNICIRDYNRKNLPDKTIGLIHIKGKNVTKGYSNNIHETLKVLGKDGWLNTGDLGFIKNGNLVITGREKDIIFANGINLYPHDIEDICSAVESKGFKARDLVVSSVLNKYDDDEQLILFVRYKSNLEDFVFLSDKLKRHINRIVGVRVLAVVPIDDIPKTTSGKVCRYKLKQDFSDGVYNQILKEIKILSDKQLQKQETIQSPEYFLLHKKKQQILDYLEQSIYELMSCRIYSKDENLIEMGIDSLKAVKLKNILEQGLSIDIPISVVFDYPTINKLANFLVTKYVDASSNSYNKLELIAS